MLQLPEMTHSFDVAVTGETTNQSYKGHFTYHRPKLGEVRQIRCMKARLNEGLKNLDEETLLLNEICSWLTFTLDERPDWMEQPLDLYDFNVLLTVWEKVLEFENKFRSQIAEIGDAKEERKESV